ncbi:MAG: PspC domain-containing protein [Actinobacteria bacterium]|nr:PspC domain-containing protein [Actinomycetota bacterium]
MNSERNNGALVIGIILIVFGAWELAHRLLSPWWPSISRFLNTVAAIVWPLAIILAGVLFIVAAKKGVISSSSGKRLYRSRTNKRIAGVCGGLAEFFSIDPAIVRIAAIVLLVISFMSLALLYIILWVVIPQEPVGNGTR